MNAKLALLNQYGRVLRHSLCVAVILNAVILSVVQAASAEDQTILRVGVVAYQDFHHEAEQYDRLVGELSSSGEQKFHAQLAFGTYGDVLHWLEQDQIDVAVLTPGLFSQAMRDPSVTVRYLATMGLPPATSHLATAERKQPGYHYRCRAACVVAASSSIRTIDDLVAQARRNQVRFIFVHPVSVAGSIAPQFAFAQLGLKVAREQVSYTHSHTGSLRIVAAPSSDAVENVAFVWDDADKDPASSESFRRVEFPALDQLWVPQSAVVARQDYSHADELQKRLLAHRDSAGNADFMWMENWRDVYDEVDLWSRTVGILATTRDLQTVTVSEIGQSILHHARSQPQRPRLAVVLSGGGAKCSFQVGAVRRLEEELESLRSSNPDQPIDIKLVVGTSGGAINALPIALGCTSTRGGQDDFKKIWQELDQRQIVQPSYRIRWNIGLWATFVQTWVIMLILRRTVPPSQSTRWLVRLLIAFGCVQIVLSYLPFSPWRLLGHNHALHHVWLWIHFGLRLSGWGLLGLGLLILAVRRFAKKDSIAQVALRRVFRRRTHQCDPNENAITRLARIDQTGRSWMLRPPKWLLRGVLVSGLLGLPLLQMVSVLFFEQTLSSGSGIEATFADTFPRLIDSELSRRDDPPLRLDAAMSASERLRATSQQLVERRLLQRDLVLTGSCLTQTSESLPSDLYFYLAANEDSVPPAYDHRGIALVDYAGILLDVVMGSGSIFPVFPPRTIMDFPDPGEQVQLVDGGFAHNSPLEAAVLWGATHVVVYEASPEKRPSQDNFFENSAAAFDHLYQQAQLLDAHSHGQVVVYTLSPESPHLCVIDFADNLIQRSIENGYRQAGGTQGSKPRYRKELGQPRLVDIMLPPAT